MPGRRRWRAARWSRCRGPRRTGRACATRARGSPGRRRRGRRAGRGGGPAGSWRPGTGGPSGELRGIHRCRHGVHALCTSTAPPPVGCLGALRSSFSSAVDAASASWQPYQREGNLIATALSTGRCAVHSSCGDDAFRRHRGVDSADAFWATAFACVHRRRARRPGVDVVGIAERGSTRSLATRPPRRVLLRPRARSRHEQWLPSSLLGQRRESWSAVLIHGLPLLGREPAVRTDRGSSIDANVPHAHPHRATLREHDVTAIGGTPVTSVARTLVDFGRHRPVASCRHGDRCRAS